MTWLDASLRDAILDHRRADGPVRGSKNHGDHDALLLNPWPQSSPAFEPTRWQTAIDTATSPGKTPQPSTRRMSPDGGAGGYPASRPKE